MCVHIVVCVWKENRSHLNDFVGSSLLYLDIVFWQPTCNNQRMTIVSFLQFNSNIYIKHCIDFSTMPCDCYMFICTDFHMSYLSSGLHSHCSHTLSFFLNVYYYLAIYVIHIRNVLIFRCTFAIFHDEMSARRFWVSPLITDRLIKEFIISNWRD